MSASAAVTCAAACRMSSVPRPGQQEAQLRVGLGTVRAQSGDGQLGIPRVEPGDDLPRGDAVAFGDRELEDATAHLGGQLHVVGLDVAGDADAIGGRVLAAACGGEREKREHAR